MSKFYEIELVSSTQVLVEMEDDSTEDEARAFARSEAENWGQNADVESIEIVTEEYAEKHKQLFEYFPL